MQIKTYQPLLCTKFCYPTPSESSKNNGLNLQKIPKIQKFQFLAIAAVPGLDMTSRFAHMQCEPCFACGKHFKFFISAIFEQRFFEMYRFLATLGCKVYGIFWMKMITKSHQIFRAIYSSSNSTDERTDTPSYRHARTHLKTWVAERGNGCFPFQQ